MKSHAILALLILAAFRPPGVEAQDLGLDPSDRVTITTKDVRDPDGTPWTTYVELGQFFPTISLRLMVAEVALVGENGQSTDVEWDHPLAGEFTSPYMPLYKYNSLEYANELVTKPFVLGQGKTLSMFRDFGFRFPTTNKDEEARGIDQDTTELDVPDAVRFRIELLDASTHEVLSVLEQLNFPRCDNWSDFSEAMFAIAQGTATLAVEKPYMLTFTAPAALAGRRCVVRITAAVEGQDEGRFTERALYARFKQFSRVSHTLVEGYKSIEKNIEHLADSVLLTLPFPKSAGDEKSVQNPSLTVYPNLLSPSESVLRVSDPAMKDGDAVSLHCVDLAGRMLHEDLRFAHGSSPVQFALPASMLEHAAFLAFVRRGESVNYSLIRSQR